MSKRRVVVTGMGIVSPVGNSLSTAWDSIINGRSGIGGILGIEQQTAKWLEGGPRKISPFYVPSTIINMLPGQISILRGFARQDGGSRTGFDILTRETEPGLVRVPAGEAAVRYEGGAIQDRAYPGRWLLARV